MPHLQTLRYPFPSHHCVASQLRLSLYRPYVAGAIPPEPSPCPRNICPIRVPPSVHPISLVPGRDGHSRLHRYHDRTNILGVRPVTAPGVSRICGNKGGEDAAYQIRAIARLRRLAADFWGQ
jgi:hypothetical protein